MALTTSLGDITYHFDVAGTTVARSASLDVRTKTVELIDGHVGQVTYKGRIVWQSRPYRRQERARDAAQARIDSRVEELFA